MDRGRNDTATPAGLADIMPTLLDICAVDDPAARDGQSLLPKISDPDAAFRQFSFGRCNEHFAVSDGRFRMQWSSEQDLYYLFDQDNDPRDCHDLADHPDFADVRRRLQEALTEWMQHHEDPLAASGTLQPQTVNRNLQFGTARNNWNNRGRHGLH
jgi:arylsulfatase A-like enzyme